MQAITPTIPSGFSSQISAVPLQEEGTHAFPIQELPHELRMMIFSCFTAKEAVQDSSVCKEWNILLNQDSLWGHYAERDGVHLEPDNSRETVPLKQHYLWEKRVCSNWIRGIFMRRSISSYALMECPYAKGRDLIVGTATGHIHMIDLSTDAVIKTFKTGVEHAITHVRRMGDKKLVFACTDNQIRIWNLETETCEQTLTPKGKLLSFHLTEEGQLFSGSDNNEIYVWNTESGAYETICDGQHTLGIISLCSTSEGDIVSLDGAGKVKKWVKKECERVFCSQETGHATHLCLTKEGLLVVGNAEGKFRVLNLKTGNCEKEISLGKSRGIISLYATKQEMLIIVDEIGEMTIWDLKGENIGMLSRTSLARMTNDWDESFCIPTERELIVCGVQKNTILDFRVPNNEIFENIASHFKMARGNQWELNRATERFNAMPDEEKEKIYQELDRILGREDSGKAAFLDSYFDDGQKKAQAITNYLTPPPS